MALREYHQFETDYSAIDWTSTDWTLTRQFDFIAKPDTDYMAMFGGYIQSLANSNQPVRCYINTDTTSPQAGVNSRMRWSSTQNNSTIYGLGSIRKIAADPAGGTKSLCYWQRADQAFNTIRTARVRCGALEMLAEDFIEADPESYYDVSVTSWQTIRTFTVPNTALLPQFFLWLSGYNFSQSASVTFEVRLRVNGTEVARVQRGTNYSWTYQPMNLVGRALNVPAGDITVDVQMQRTAGTGIVSAGNLTLFATGDDEAFWYTVDDPLVATSSTVPIETLPHVERQEPANRKTLFLASWALSHAAGQGYAQSFMYQNQTNFAGGGTPLAYQRQYLSNDRQSAAAYWAGSKNDGGSDRYSLHQYRNTASGVVIESRQRRFLVIRAAGPITPVSLEGSAAGQSSASAALDVINPVSLSGQADGQSDAQAGLSRQVRLSGQAAGQLAAQADLGQLLSLSGQAAGQSNTQATLGKAIPIQGLAAGQSNAGAILRALARLSGSAAGLSSAAATMQVAALLSGVASCQSSVRTAILTVKSDRPVPAPIPLYGTNRAPAQILGTDSQARALRGTNQEPQQIEAT